MIWLKGCPKCHGDMHYDPLVEEYVCLQCGLAVQKPPEESLSGILTSGASRVEPLRLDPKSTEHIRRVERGDPVRQDGVSFCGRSFSSVLTLDFPAVRRFSLSRVSPTREHAC
jgi:hypothetical protein